MFARLLRFPSEGGGAASCFVGILILFLLLLSFGPYSLLTLAHPVLRKKLFHYGPHVLFALIREHAKNEMPSPDTSNAELAL